MTIHIQLFMKSNLKKKKKKDMHKTRAGKMLYTKNAESKKTKVGR